MSLPGIRVCCAVLIRNGKVFAARRGPDARHPLLWEFPGGKVEKGESDEQCLQRELMEELGMTVEILGRLKAVRHVYDSFEIELLPFLCRQTNANIRAVEHAGTAWLGPEEMRRVIWSAADLAIVEQVLEEFL